MALTQALAGAGGVGKYQLAAQVAYRHGHRLDVVRWVSCAVPDGEVSVTSASLARAGLAALGSRLGLAPGDCPGASGPGCGSG